MRPHVKALAIRVLTHSGKDIELMHRTMRAELGDDYTETDRAQLEEAVRTSHNVLRRQIEAM